MVGGEVRRRGLGPVGRRLAEGVRELAARRWPVLVAAAVALGAAVGAPSILLQQHFQQVYLGGGRLAGWQDFLRQGAPWEALPPVLAATLLVLVGWARLGSAAPEPSYTVVPERTPSVSQLRAMLRRERGLLLIVTEAVLVVVGAELVRGLMYCGLALAGDRTAAATLPGLTLQAAAWLACGGAVIGWRRGYLSLLQGWGV